jgi:hypothetical protein
MAWVDCLRFDCEDGYVNRYDEDPLWFDDEYIVCDECQGRGGWWQCVRTMSD